MQRPPSYTRDQSAEEKRKRELHLCSSLGAYRVQSAEEKDWEANSTPAASK